MKQWKCKVCGYIHTGDEPPERCPVCGAPKDKFRLVEEDEETQRSGDAVPVLEGADVLVVGSGAAALSAAVTAKSKGLSVILFEKGADIGGTTARSGGGFWVPNNRHQKEAGIADNRDACLRYMARYSYSNLYDPDDKKLGLPDHEYDLLEAYYDHASEMEQYLSGIEALQTVMEINWTGKPQVDYMDHLPENGGIRGRSIYPMDKNGKQGFGDELIAQLYGFAKKIGVDILPRHEVTEILMQEGRVRGLIVHSDAGQREYIAEKGVIFGSGGFSHNPGYMLRFQRGPHYGGCAVPTNTGDFVTMAGGIGAQLGNMAGAFRADSMLEAALAAPGGSSNLFYIAGDSVLLVDKYGKRYVDEKRNYTDRAMSHFVWDAQKTEWRNLLTFLLFDDRTATLWQGFPPYPVKDGGDGHHFVLRADTLDALEKELRARLEKHADKTGGFMLDDSFGGSLKDTVARFNEFAKSGEDLDFRRGDFNYDREWTTFPPTVPSAAWPEKGVDNYTMHPISDSGPYYAVILAAGTLDTNGGPVVNGRAQVLDWQNQPIPGLYGAGNCIASPTANAYWGAGSTIGPALTFGYLAAKDIAGA